MTYDLLIIGGGINGASIARDAAGRGWRVLLVERDDLAGHTSSASSKLAHGGLRYLEMYDFKLVHEALRERMILFRTAPHLARPLRFLLPHAHSVRPYWLVRLGLALYDTLALGGGLPKAHRHVFEDDSLKPEYRRGFAYWDGWVDDARLVIANAHDAAERGAEILTRTAFGSARRLRGLWRADLSDGRWIEARAIVNAAGPWVAGLLGDKLPAKAQSRVRLVRGTHIVVTARLPGDDAYILQQPDRRVVFAIPYEGHFTLIGTTDVSVEDPADAIASDAEAAYLIAAYNRYFRKPIAEAEIVHRFAGIRALHDSGETSASAVTRDYHLELDDDDPPLLSIFGGKITTARHLAEVAVDRIATLVELPGRRWTAKAALPGGDLDANLIDLLARTKRRYPFLPPATALRMAQAYGSALDHVLGDARALSDLGEEFGGGLTIREVEWLVTREWARTAEDILWRRTKIGLVIDDAGRTRLERYLAGRRA